MRQRAPLVLSVTALAVAVLGTTPLGHAAGEVVAAAVPPFAKTAGFAKLAGNSTRLNGRKSTLNGAAGSIPVVGANGKLPASLGAVGPQGPKGDRGPAGANGLVAAYTKLTGAGAFEVLPTSGTVVATLALPAGRYVLFGRVNVGWEVGKPSWIASCTLSAGPESDSVLGQGPTPSTATLTLTILHDFDAAGSASLRCSNASNGAAGARWARARITAIAVAPAGLKVAPP